MSPDAASPTPEESRLQNALRRADDLLLSSLQSEEKNRRKSRKRKLIFVSLIGVIAMLSAAIYLSITLAGSGGSAVVPAVVAAATTPTAAAVATAPALPTFKINAQVEIKTGGQWEAATILKREKNIYQVHLAKYAKTDFFDEWVTLDRIRNVGDKRDIPFTMPTAHGQKPTAERQAEALKVFDPNAADAPETATPTAAATDKPAAPISSIASKTLTPANLQTASPLAISDAFTYTPDASTVVISKNNPIPLSAATGAFFEKPGNFVITPTGKAAITFINAEPGKAAIVRLNLLDLLSAKSLAVIPLDATSKLADLSPDGSVLALLTNNFQFGENQRVDLLSLSADGKAAPLISFEPYATDDKFKSDVTWAALPDSNHLLTISSGRKITLWKIPEASAVWTADLDYQSTPIFSPNRKYLIIPVKTHPTLINISTGASAGILPGNLPINTLYAFRSDGAQLATLYEGKMQIIDLASNSVINSFDLPANLPNIDSLAWAGDKHLLLANQFLVKPELGLITWNYHSDRLDLSASFANHVWIPKLGQASKKALLVSAAPPDASVLAAESKIDMDQAFAIKAGSSVSLQVDLAGQGDTGIVTDALSHQLAANHIVLAAGQPNKLVATITNGKSHDMSYTSYSTGQKQTISVTDLVLTFQFTVDGKVAWSGSSGFSAPMFISLKKDQTTEQYIEERKAEAWKFFTHAELPARVPAPRDTLGFGESSLIK